jgi:NAD-dependent deacetylase
MRTIFFTGAGLSADSGVPTFRGPGGLYNGIPAEYWLTGENYSREPWRSEIDLWYDARRKHLATCEPNAAHLGIASYALRYPETLVITQNVDDLLERAGLPEDRIMHLHGSLLHLLCVEKGHRLRIGYRRDPDLVCPEPGCGSRLRADIVLFGENAPLYQAMWQALDQQGPDDALVVIGTQGTVISIGEAARVMPGLRLLNNLHSSAALDESSFDQVFRAPAAETFPRILEILEQWRSSRH